MIFSADDEVFLCTFSSFFTGEDMKGTKENMMGKAAFKMSFAIESLRILLALDEMIFFSDADRFPSTTVNSKRREENAKLNGNLKLSDQH